MIAERVTVLVTACGGGGHGEQILKALLQGKDERFEVIAADLNPNTPQLQWVDRSFVLPPASSPDYLDTLFERCEEHGVKAVFHGCEPELRLFSENRGDFRDRDIFLPINPAEVIERCMDKRRTLEFLSSHGFRYPEFREMNRLEDAEGIDFFPAVLKPAVGSGGSANCFIVQSRDELVALSQYLHIGEENQSFMIQEYCGTPQNEFTAGVLSDMDGTVINSIAVKRNLGGSLGTRLRVVNRTDRTDLGSHLVISSGISQGWIGRFPEVTGQCERIASSLGSTGALNIQCRLVDGVVMVFEINPRFSGTTSLRAMVGYNEPLVLLRSHFFGEKPEKRFEYEEAYISRSLGETIIQE